ncbi:FUSC family protein [Cohnella candidum]|nr:aromatic acid exporter family protein [Cohnella candidum]
MNRLLPSNRTIKAVLAAVLSWLIANRMGSEHPFFAPLAAILCLQVTVEKSIRLGFQRILGILVGVTLASGFVHTFGTHWWSLALLLLIGLTVGQAFKFPQYTYMQIGTSALLVLTVGTQASYGIDRIVETLIGAVIAIAVNLTVIPPDFSRETEKLLHHAASDLASYYRQYSKWFRDDTPVSASEDLRRSFTTLAQDLNHTSSKLEQAMHALKFSPFTRGRRKRLEYLKLLLNTLILGCMQGVELQKNVLEASRLTDFKNTDRKRWTEFFSGLADYIEMWRDDAIPGNVPKPTMLLKILERTSMTAETYMSACWVQTRRLLQDFTNLDGMEERIFPEARLATGKESDGKSRGHDLFES